MMKPTLPLGILLLLLLAPAFAHAQVSLHIDIGLPVAPPLVEVQPGIQVVEGYPDEVFFNMGWYWCRRGDGWYRARSPRARFDRVDARFVPIGLTRLPPGHYRNWHHGDDMPGDRRGRFEDRHDNRRGDRRDDRFDDRHRGGPGGPGGPRGPRDPGRP